MKKNLITVIILAICIVNLVFNILLVFVFMPSMQKTNNLITSISEILDIELAAMSEENNGKVDINNLSVYTIEEGNAINLKDDGSGKLHYLQVSLSLTLDKGNKDYKATVTNLDNGKALILDAVRNECAQYTFAEVTDVSVQDQIKKDILLKLQDTFQTDCIYSISFSDFVAQ